jgi:nucleoside-diphosphate-sugar epimerase
LRLCPEGVCELTLQKNYRNKQEPVTRVLVVGSSGYVGRNLVEKLQEEQAFLVSAASRNPVEFTGEVTCFRLPESHDLLGEDDLHKLFVNVDVVIHLAAVTPALLSTKTNAERQKALQANREMPLFFARAAKKFDVKKFIYLSSCGVHGVNSGTFAFSETSAYAAHDDYTQSKIDAEKRLLSNEAAVPQLTIIRPPSVYGAGALSPMNQLLQIVKRQWPLPFGSATQNSRQSIGVRNLCDFLLLCIQHPNAASSVFMVADTERLSTRELLTVLAAAAQVDLRLLNVPTSILLGAASFVGARSKVQRLLGNYEIDTSVAFQKLNWAPRYSVAEECRAMAEGKRIGTQ